MFDPQFITKKATSASALVTSISSLLKLDGGAQHYSSFTPSIYDTAWVSIVRGKEPQSSWLFPEAFEFVLKAQRNDGTWESYASPVDGILNTLASLLALLVHKQTCMSEDRDASGLAQSVNKACKGLQELLMVWPVDETVHVGFEILVPSLLSQLEHYGFRFDFPGRPRLNELYEAKIKKFKPEVLYQSTPITLLHSLEACIGLVDFGKLNHCCSESLGVFGSPAATAAYLLNSPIWDDRAEKYLKMVVSESLAGGVPSAYPTGLFEISWALSTLMPQVVRLEDLAPDVIDSLANYFRTILEQQAGMVGFAPGILADADDTARVLLTLHYLGVQVDTAPMVNGFATAKFFRTYRMESKPSLSANCNVLLALLCVGDTTENYDIIHTVAEYLTSIWSKGTIVDKWNLSPFYSKMLLAEALINYLQRYSEHSLSQGPKGLVESAIPITLCQILSQTLQEQLEDGSWRHSIEQTAYSMILISNCSKLPWAAALHAAIQDSYRRATQFISTESASRPEPEYLWVEKVTYGSTLLRVVYELAAVNLKFEIPEWNSEIRASFEACESYLAEIGPFMSNLPLLVNQPLQHVGLALVEASRFKERLHSLRTTIFPRDELPMSGDRYLSYIPAIWTICNQTRTHALVSECVWDMIVLSMLNYQIDEYMETVVDDVSASELQLLVSHIRKVCAIDGSYTAGCQSLASTVIQNIADLPADNRQGSTCVEQENTSFAQTKVAKVIDGYVTHILQHEAVRGLPFQEQRSLALALQSFLMSHIIQNLNSRLLQDATLDVEPRENGRLSRLNPLLGFFVWVRSPGSESTSCPFSFRFFAALLGHSSNHAVFQGARQRFLSSALASHLATMCRMYNDYGSAARDAEERNLNSLDFTEFLDVNGAVDSEQIEKARKYALNGIKLVDGSSNESAKLQTKKEDLLSIAQFERGCMELAFQQLAEAEKDPITMTAVRVFIDVTDLFGQIYVARDIASRLKQRATT